MSHAQLDQYDLDAIRRWNFEADDRGLRVCRGEHDRGQPCQFETLSGIDALRLIEQLRNAALRPGHDVVNGVNR